MKASRSLRPSFLLVTSAALGCSGPALSGDNTNSTDATPAAADTGTTLTEVECPDVAPAVGAPCSAYAAPVAAWEQTFCSYGESSGCDGSGRCMVCAPEFVCDSELHTWQRGGIVCNPPSVVCPPLPPPVGSACLGVGRCSYEAYGQCGNAATTYVCSYASQAWSVESPLTEPHATCPQVAPKNGDACTGCFLEACSYCGAHATCDADTKKWIVQESSCNPPPVLDGGTP